MNKKCIICNNDFSIDELSQEQMCYDCSNKQDEINTDALVKELLESTINSLAKAKNTTPLKIKTDLVAEHIYESATKIKKDVSNN